MDHWSGTDGLGRDVFSRIIIASRYSLGVGFGATALATGLALFIGIGSAYAGKTADAVFQRIVDSAMSIPPLLLLIFIVALLGAGIWTVIAVIGLISAIRNSRVIRGSTLEIMSLDYMDAARIIGASWPRIAFRYILPNIMAPVIVLFSLGLGSAILVESSLSFLGYGVPPPAPTWGQMLGLDAQRFFFVAPWLAIAPGVALTIVVFAINIFGDALRDRLDPRQRGT
jgi:peptide/nickel transport system permease protein